MANLIRIFKRYKNGIESEDVVSIEGGAEGAAKFITKINAKTNHDFEILDWEVVLVGKGDHGEQIVKNPTGGRTGTLH